MRSLIFAMVIIFTANLACAEIYKWRDENGTIHFSDKPSNEKPVELFAAPVDSIYEYKYNNNSNQSLNYRQSNNNYQSTNGINTKTQGNSTANIVKDKKLSEKKRKEDIKEFLEKEKNRPKSAAEIKKEVLERQKQRRIYKKQLRQAGIY